MIYYKVKPVADQKHRSDGSIYIANELYTEKEALKLKLKFSLLEKLSIKKTQTYWCFGARFASTD